jgi:hypothetical protein
MALHPLLLLLSFLPSALLAAGTSAAPTCGLVLVAVAVCAGHESSKGWLHCWRPVLCCGSHLKPLWLFHLHLHITNEQHTAIPSEFAKSEFAQAKQKTGKLVRK